MGWCSQEHIEALRKQLELLGAESPELCSAEHTLGVEDPMVGVAGQLSSNGFDLNTLAVDTLVNLSSPSGGTGTAKKFEVS